MSHADHSYPIIIIYITVSAVWNLAILVSLITFPAFNFAHIYLHVFDLLFAIDRVYNHLRVIDVIL